MRYYFCSIRLNFLLVSCCLVFVLAACSADTKANSHAPTPTVAAGRNSSTPGVAADKKAVNKPVVSQSAQTDCPSSGLARPALLKSLTHGTHPTLVYTSNDVSRDGSTSVGVLKHYDSVTQRTSIITTSGYSISNAQVSADGQWVLFLSQGSASKGNGNGSAGGKLQLVRIDGAGLQTLYCVPSAATISGIHWSADQKSILLDMLDANTNVSTLRLLDIVSGTLKTELQTPLGPSAYKTILWLDASHAYVRQGNGDGQNAAQPVLYLLDTVNNKDARGGDLKKISDFPVSGGGMRLESSADKSVDAKTLYLSYCFSNGATLMSRIISQPATGGARQDVYQNLQGCIKDLRVIPGGRLLFTIRVPDRGNTKEMLTLAKVDGSGTTALYNGGVHLSIQLNRHAASPWSNTSRDGNLYAFNEQGAMMRVSKLMVGSFSSGQPAPLVSNPSGTVSVAGWTTI